MDRFSCDNSVKHVTVSRYMKKIGKFNENEISICLEMSKE